MSLAAQDRMLDGKGWGDVVAGVVYNPVTDETASEYPWHQRICLGRCRQKHSPKFASLDRRYSQPFQRNTAQVSTADPTIRPKASG